MLKKSTITTLFSIALLLGTSLSGCAYMQGRSDERHSAICSQLKNKILMNGATGDQREAQMQRSELANLNRTYRAEGCE